MGRSKREKHHRRVDEPGEVRKKKQSEREGKKRNKTGPRMRGNSYTKSSQNLILSGNTRSDPGHKRGP